MTTIEAPSVGKVVQSGLHGVPHTGQVDIERAVPHVLGHLPRRRTRGVDARVGHDDVQPPELDYPRIDDSSQRFEVRDIGQARHTAPTPLLHLRCGVA